MWTDSQRIYFARSETGEVFYPLAPLLLIGARWGFDVSDGTVRTSLWRFVRAFGWASIGMTVLVIAAGIKTHSDTYPLAICALHFLAYCTAVGWLSRSLKRIPASDSVRLFVHNQSQDWLWRLVVCCSPLAILAGVSASQAFGTPRSIFLLAGALFFGANAVFASYFLRKLRLDQNGDLRPRQQ